jgi:hypothetical protein
MFFENACLLDNSVEAKFVGVLFIDENVGVFLVSQ